MSFTRINSRAEFEIHRDALVAYSNGLQRRRNPTNAFKLQERKTFRKEFGYLREVRYSPKSRRDEVVRLCEEICGKIDLQDFAVVGTIVNPRPQPISVPLSGMETESSFDRTQNEFRKVKQKLVKEFQDQLNRLVDVDPITIEERRMIVDWISKTRKELAVALLYQLSPNKPPVRVFLDLSSRSFQLKVSGVNRHTIFSSVVFPRLKAVDSILLDDSA